MHESGALPVWMEFHVLAANVYDSLFGSGDVLDGSVTQFAGSAITAAAGIPEVKVASIAANAITAAAVAAGMIPIAHANDGGGSTRIPAACCGLVGLKVQRGRISAAPLLGYSFLGVDGVVSRTTRDTAVALDVLAGHALGDVAWAAPSRTPFALPAAETPRALRIAMTSLSPVDGIAVEPRVLEALDESAALLRDLGHEVIEDDPPWQIPGLIEQFGVLWAPMISTQLSLIHISEPTRPC